MHIKHFFIIRKVVRSCFYSLLKYLYFQYFYCFYLTYLLNTYINGGPMPFTFHWFSGLRLLKCWIILYIIIFISIVSHIIAKIKRHTSGCRGQDESSDMDVYLTTCRQLYIIEMRNWGPSQRRNRATTPDGSPLKFIYPKQGHGYMPIRVMLIF